MNNTFELAFAAIFNDMDSAPDAVKVEYHTWTDGYEARTRGEPCPPGASELFKAGQRRCYEQEMKSDEGY